jgi:DNA polymerase-1
VAIREAEFILQKWTQFIKPNTVILCFSCSSKTYFRHDIYPEYKAQRRSLERPQALNDVIAYLKDKYKFLEIPGLEADDVMGIYGTATTLTNPVIVSIDKDMQTVPAKVFNPDKMRRPVRINPAIANTLMFKQAMTGDSTDNYRGIPGTGPAKAEKIIQSAPAANVWPTIEKAFLDEKLTRDYAITMVRLARILRAEDFNFETGEVRLWHPEKPEWMMPSTRATTNEAASRSTTSSSKSVQTSPVTKPPQSPTSSSISADTEPKTTDSTPPSTSAKPGGISTGSSNASKRKRRSGVSVDEPT